jgi:gliding motility-associated-like protein
LCHKKQYLLAMQKAEKGYILMKLILHTYKSHRYLFDIERYIQLKIFLFLIVFKTFSVSITKAQCPTSLFAQDSLKVCGATQVLDAGAGYSTYRWSTGATTQTITPNRTGWYSATISTMGCPSFTDKIFLNILNPNIPQTTLNACSGTVLNFKVDTSYPYRNFVTDTLIYLGTFNGHYYYLTETSYTWTVADAYAKSIDAYLVTINDAAEQSFITSNAGAISGGSYSIGCYRNSVAPTFTDPSGNGWAWTNGETTTYSNWAGGEPNSTAELYGRCRFFGGIWGWLDVTNSAVRAVFESNKPLVNTNLIPQINWSTGNTGVSLSYTATTATKIYATATDGVGTCTDSVQINIITDNSASSPSATPTLCINTPLPNITHTTVAATGITNNNVAGANGLPAGVRAVWASNTITISGTPTASGTFNYSIRLTGGCGTVDATGTITVGAANTVSAASASPTLCINTPLTDITHTTTLATGIGTPTNLPAGVSAVWGGNTITISGTPTASGTFNYSIPLTGGCGTVNATGTIIVNANNTVSAASSTPTLCINAPLVTNITHNTARATGIGTATGLSNGITAVWAANRITINGTPTESGTFNYSIPLTGGCGPTINATGTITVNPDNTVSAASATPTLCINTPLTNITHTTTRATGISNNGVFSANGLPAGVRANWAGNTITIGGTPTVSGTFNYSILLIGGCGTVNATGTITVTPAPTPANAGSDQTGASTCGVTQVTLAGNTPTIGTGTWSIISGAGGNFTDANNPTTTFSGAPGTAYVLRWTISNSPCTSSSDDVNITFNQNPNTANAGTDQTGSATCGGTQVTLAGNAPTVGTGTWSIISGSGGSFANANNPTTIFSGTAGNTYTLRWTISNSPCVSSFDEVLITFNQQPTTANAGADQTGAATCGGTQVTLAGDAPTVGTGTWSIISGSGGSFANTNSPTTTFNGTAGTTYTLRWTISNNPCTASTDDVIITFNQNPTPANAGPDQTGAATCGLTLVTLAGNTPSIGTGTWAVVSGLGGSFADATSPTTTFSGTAGATYTLRWTISNSPCTASTDDVIITFNQNPSAANAGVDQIGAATCGLTQVSLVANTPAVGTGTWSIISGSGGSFGNPNNPATTFDGTPGSSYTLRWTIISSGTTCTSSSDDVTVTFNQIPTTADAGTDQIGAATCGLTQVALAGNTPTVGTGIWSIVSGPGGSITNPNNPAITFNGIAGNSYTLRWTISNNPCASSLDEVLITFNQQPTTANAGTDETGASTCGLTSVTLAANTPTVGTGAWTIVSGTGGSFTDGTNPTTTFNGSAGATFTLRWTITNGAICNASQDDVVITFNRIPTVAAAGADQTGTSTCGLTQVTLAANTPSIGTGTWTVVSGVGGSFTNANDPATTFNGTAGATYTLRWTISNGVTCNASTDDVVITFNQNPTPAAAGTDQTGASTCGLTSVTLAANTPTIGIGAWTVVSGTGGSFSNANNPTTIFNGTAGSSYTLRWTVSNASCTAATDDVSITFNQSPTTANAGADQTGAATCGLTQVTLAANTPTVGTGTWSIVSGTGGSFSDATNPASTFDGIPGTAYTLRWAISNNPCIASTDDVLITFNQNPTQAAAGGDQIDVATCGLTQVTLAANTPAAGTGTWTIISGSGGSFTNANSATTTFNGTTGTSYNLRWTIANNPCAASFDDVVITLNQNPTQAAAGVDQTDAATCGRTQVTLAGNNPTVGTGTWTVVSGIGGSFTNANSATTTFNGTAGNTYTLRWTISNGSCTASTDDVDITFNQVPTTANAGADQIGASTCGLTQVTLAANTPGVGTGAWTIVSGSGGTFGNATSPTSTFDGTAGNTYTLRWTITNGAICNASSDDVLVTFNVNPTTATAGADQIDAATCGLTQVTLAGNTPSMGTGTWSIISGTGGSFTDSNNPTTTFSGAAGASYTLRWTINNNPCTASFDDVIVTFNQNPTQAEAGADQTGASTCGLTQVTLAANTPAIGTGTWSIVSGTGGTITNPNSPSSTFIGTAGSTYTLRWTVSNGTICPSSTDDVDITFNQFPTTSNAGVDQTDAATCGLTQVTLAANTPAVGTGNWTIVNGTGGSFADATNPASTFDGAQGTAYTLRWTISNGAICNPSSDDVLVTFNQQPTTANAGADQVDAATCGLTTVTLAGNTPTVGTGIWTIVSGTGGSLSNANSPSSTFNGIAGNTYTLRWIISNNPCAASSDDVVITFNQNPTPANAGTDQTGTSTCGLTQVTLAANTPTVGTGLWSIVSGIGGTITNTNSPISTFNGVAGSTYTLRWTASNGAICPASTDEVTITFNQGPTTSNAGADQTGAATCGLTQVTLAANTPAIGTGVWTIVSGAGGSFTNAGNPSTTFDGTPGASYTLRWTISNGTFCPSLSDDMNVTFNQVPSTADAGTDQNNAATCGLTQVTLSANTPTVGSGGWTSVSGTGGSFANANNPSTTFSGTAGATYTLRWTISNSPCTATTDDVLVTFNQNPGTPAMTVTQQPDCFIATGTLAINTPSGPAYEFSNDGINFQSASSFSGLAPGNYTITVRDINNGCISSAISPAITAQPLPSVRPIVGTTETYCQRDQAVPLRALGNNLRWYSSPSGGTGSANAPVPSTASAGTVNYYVTQQLTGFCESPRVAIPVSVRPLPVADAGPDKEIIEGQRVEIEGNASGNNIDILWTTGIYLSNAKIENPFASPEVSTTYRITVTSADGCVATDEMRITVKLPKALEIPNAFSPNGDGFNDRWVIKNIDEYPNAVVQIFNRYGKQVFEITGYSNSNAWDGKVSGVDLPVGPYYYIIKPNSKKRSISGVISIIR